jgi:hypothetical protein
MRITKGCDVVYHRAAAAYEAWCFQPILRDAERRRGVRGHDDGRQRRETLRFLSSMARYGTQDRTPFMEDMTPRPGPTSAKSPRAVSGRISRRCMAWYVIAVRTTSSDPQNMMTLS